MIRRLSHALLSIPLVLTLASPAVAATEEGSFDSAGVPIHFTDMGGDGEPAVLIHSFTSSSDMWTKAGFEPSDDLRYIALDVRGHGQSGIETDNQDTAALAAVARSMDEIIDLPEQDVAGIAVPVLGIVSENDPERPYIERMDGVVPDFDLELIPAGPTGDPSLDHMSAILDPAFRDSIVDFLVEAS